MGIRRAGHKVLSALSIRLLLICSIPAIAMLSFATGCAHKSNMPHSGNDDLPRSLGPINNPKPPTPVPLTANTVDEFLVWVQNVPQSQTALIRQQVAVGAKNSEVIDALAKRLFEIPIQDIGRHLMILSILGETQNPRAVEPLIRFIWLDGPLVEELPEVLGPGNHTSRFNYNGGLRARAAEMLAYIGTEEALRATRDVVSKHPGQEVRIAAIDAYLFNHNDSDEAKAELQRITQPDETKLIGIPRRTRDMNVKEFDARLNAFYERYPDERPPVPEQQNPDQHPRANRGAAKSVPESAK